MRLFRKTVAAVLCIAMLALLSIPALAANAQPGTLYSVEKLAFDGEKLIASVVASKDCTIVAAFYDETAETMLCGTSARVSLCAPGNAQTVNVTIDCSSLGLPTYFIVRAYLLDDNLRSLCEPYSTKQYTEAFHAFSQKNALDYTNYPCISFTDDGDSFAAIKRDAMVLENNGTSNIITGVKDASGQYVFTQISSDLKALKPGRVLYYPYGSKAGEYILIKVASVEFSSDTKCVVYAAPAALSELFECIKIDIDLVPEVDTSAALESGVTYFGKADDGAFIYDIDSRWLASEVKGRVRLEAGAHFSMFYDSELFGEDYYELSFTADFSADTEITLSRKLEKTITMLPVKLSSPVAHVVAAAVPQFIVSADGGCSVIASQNASFGASYSSLFGYCDISEAPDAELLAFNCDENTAFSSGMTVAYKFSVLKNCSINAQAKQKCTFNAVLSEASPEHSCEKCFAIHSVGGLSFAADMTVGRSKPDGILSRKYENSDITCGDYYNSCEKGFGEGVCPSVLAALDEGAPPILPEHSYAGDKELAEYSANSGAVSFNRGVPDKEYTVILVKDAAAKPLLSSENLVYIGITRSDTDGLLTILYKTAKSGICNALVCGDVNGSNLCAHVPEAWTSEIVPPCMLVGIDAVYCAKCGETLSERTVPGKSHEWGEWEIIKEATLENEGLKRHTCSLCGQSEGVAINKLERKDYPVGDVDGDMYVTASDARLALRHAVRLDSLADRAFICADVDGNETVSSADARIILRIAVKLESYPGKTITVIE